MGWLRTSTTRHLAEYLLHWEEEVDALGFDPANQACSTGATTACSTAWPSFGLHGGLATAARSGCQFECAGQVGW